MNLFLKTLLFILTLFTFYNCKEEKKSVNKTLNLKKKEIIKKEITRPWDSLNNKNTEVFLAEYGKQNQETKVIIKTDFGNIKLLLYKDVPIHRANFVFLTKIKYFNSTVFYRVAKNFVIQGGNSDEMHTQKQRRKYGNYLMKPEYRKNRTHKYGALAAAREYEDNPDKLSSPFEFYIVHNRKGSHHLDNNHTVFGEVISGFDTMDKIANVKVGVDQWPEDDVKMRIEILD